MSTANKRLVAIIAFVGILLLIPLIAMQFTSEVTWSVFDFLVAGVLLLVTGLLVEGVLRTVKTKSKRLLLVSVILLILALIWIELAVGLFGTPFAGS
jgi:hypothetical protein